MRAGVIAISCLVAGYVLGGVIYETTGDHIWTTPLSFVERFQTLIAGAIALWGAAATIRAIRGQIDADDGRHRREEIASRIAAADALAHLPLAVSVKLERKPDAAVPAYVISKSVATMDEAMDIDGRLGAAMSGFILDCEQWNDERIPGPTTVADVARNRAGARVLRIRARLLAEGFQVASRAIEASGAVPADALLTADLANSLYTPEPTSDELGWIAILMTPREVPPVKAHPTLPA